MQYKKDIYKEVLAISTLLQIAPVSSTKDILGMVPSSSFTTSFPQVSTLCILPTKLFEALTLELVCDIRTLLLFLCISHSTHFRLPACHSSPDTYSKSNSFKRFGDCTGLSLAQKMNFDSGSNNIKTAWLIYITDNGGCVGEYLQSDCSFPFVH